MNKATIKKSIFILALMFCCVFCVVLMQTTNVLAAENQTFTLTIYDGEDLSALPETIEILSTENYSAKIPEEDSGLINNDMIIQYFIYDETKEDKKGDPFSFEGFPTGNLSIIKYVTQGYKLYEYKFSESTQDVSIYIESDLDFNIFITPLTEEEKANGYAYYNYNPTSKKAEDKVLDEEIGVNLEATRYVIKLKEYKIKYYNQSHEVVKEVPVTNLYGECNINTNAPSLTLDDNQQLLGWTHVLGSTDIESIYNCKFLTENRDYYPYIENQKTYTLNLDTKYTSDLPGDIQGKVFKTVKQMYEYIKNITAPDHYNVLVTAQINGEEIKVVSNQSLYTGILYVDDENIALTVGLETKKYKINIDYKGGTPNAQLELQEYDISKTEDIPLPTEVTRSGFKFVGYEINGSPKLSNTEWVIDVSELKDFNVVALYELKAYTLELKYKKGEEEITIQTSEQHTIKVGDKFSALSLYTDAIEGYTINSWSYDGIKNVKFDTKFEQNPPDGDTITLYASYSPKSYKITKDFGFNETQDIDIVFGEKYSLTSPQKVGYDFGGWIYEENEFAKEGVYSIPNNITVTAKWIPKKYTITVNVKDKKYTFDVNFGSSCSILNDEIKSLMNCLVGFEGDGVVVGRSGIIENYNVPNNIELTAKDLIEFDLTKPIYNSATFNLTGLQNISIYLNDVKEEIKDPNKLVLTKIGNYKIDLYVSNALIYSKELVIDADLGIESKVYENPIVLKEVDAKVLVDGKEIDQKGYRITKDGKHTIKVVGVNGYEKTYTVEYKNNNILYAIIMSAIAFVVAAGVGVMLFMGRKNVIKYDNND